MGGFVQTNNLFLDQLKTVARFEFLEVMVNTATKQKSLYTLKQINANDIIVNFSASEIQKTPTYLTVQIELEKHIILNPDYLKYINHSCNPNVFFDTSLFQVIALRNIEIGEELCFFYPSTEWVMTQPFKCNCGEKNCLSLIKGAKYINKKTLCGYKLNKFITNKMHTAIGD